MRTIALATCLAVLASSVAAQAPQQPVEPKTKLEAFVAQDGVVIIRGFRKIGQLGGAYGGTLTVEAKEFANASTAKRAYGMTITVKDSSRLEREDTSYIDYDEIESLVRGLEYIGKVDKSVTRFENFQADYRTRGDLEVSTFSTHDGSTMVAVSSGRISPVRIYFPISDLAKIRDLVAQAKAALDSVKQ
jgi:hypothetical protein